MKRAFANARNLAGEQASDAPNLSQVTDMAGMFVEARRFNQNISSWDVSEVKDMKSMFHDARAFNQNIGNWNVSEVKDMKSMFHDARAFNQNIGNWNVSEVKDMKSMFHDARAFNQNIGNWNVSEVKDMERMFYRARAFNQNISSWDVSGVTDMSSMFQYAAKFNQNIGNWDVSGVTRMFSMFQGATTFNQNIGNWDVSGVTGMSSMFQSATTFNQDISRWDVSSVRHMNSVFQSATTFNQDISRWDVSPNGGRTSVEMIGILGGATAFTQNLGLWYISHDLVDLAILPTVEARDEVATFHGQNAFLARGRSGRYVLSGEDSHFFTLTQPTSAQGALADAAVLTINEDPGVVGTEYRIIISAVKHPATFRLPYGTNNHREFTFVVNNRPDITSHMMVSLKEIMLAENTQKVTDIAASDMDMDTLTYTLSAHDAALFEITDAGALNFKTDYIPDYENPRNSRGKIDEEADQEYSVLVTVSDGVSTDKQKITVTIADANDAPTLADTTLQIAENSANEMAVETITGEDQDATAPNNELTYSITDGNINEAFAISSSTGEITVNGEDKIDFETISSYELIVTVADGGNPSLTDTATITVNVNDVNEAPTLADETFELLENSVDGASVGDIMGQDPDIEAPNNELTYSITDGNTDGAFAISSSTGEITVNGEDKIDFETTPFYTLTVQVDDGGSSALTDTATIMVNVTDVNEAPTLEDVTLQIAENSVDEMAVETITGEDQDTTAPNNVLTYSIIDGDTDGAFAISSSTGEITVNGEDKIDFETTPFYTLTVQVADGGAPVLIGTATIMVNVTDVNEAPIITSLNTFTVAENQPAVATLTVTDVDTGDTPTFSETITGTDAAAFTLTTGGVLTFNDNPNFETKSSYSITITVADGGNPSLTDTATITVNVTDVNEAPTLENVTLQIAENSANEMAVETITGEDQDTTAPNNVLTYSITDGNINEAFAISDAGEITVNGEDKIDFETTPFYTLTVQVDDGGTPALIGTATIMVNVTDVNEAPIITSSNTFTVAENQPAVATLTVTDVDTGDTPTFSETITGTDAAAFTLTTGGVLTFNDNPNFETKSSYSITITVADGGNPSLTDTQDITVNVNDVNEAPTLENTTLQVSENSVNGANVGDITGQDPDTTAPNNVLTYSITDGNTNEAFAISDAGEITVNGEDKIDFETTPFYTLTVQVADGGAPVLIGTATIMVNVTDVNEAPIITSLNTFTVAENQPAVATLTVTDVDTGDTPTFSETITGTDAAAFTLTTGGVLTFNDNPNFETKSSYSITITVADGGNPSLTDTQDITVNVNDVNEAPTLADEIFELLENLVDGASVGDIMGQDPDIEAPNNELTYSIIDGNTNDAFAISNAGEITVNGDNKIDFETTAVYTLTVRVTDGGTPALIGTATIMVNVNLAAPDISPSVPTLIATVGTAITPITIITHNGGAVDSYSIMSNLPAGLSINPSSGEISGTPTAIAEAIPYTITITATNNAGMAMATVIITVNAPDTTAPIITLTGANPQTIESGVDYTELGATTDDGSDVSVDSSEYRNVVGTYIITYTATDGTNQATATRTVNVVDTTAPVAPVITSPATLTNENTVTITGTTVEGSTVTLTQNDNVLTSTVTIDSDGTWFVDVTLIQGVNTFTATATDQAGNISDVSNSVTVTLDNTAPIITLTGANPQTIELGADYTELGATTDDGSEVSIDSSAYRNVVGTYIITYTATDGTNQATATRTVNVVDTTAPVAPVITSPATLTNENTVTITGTTVEGSTVTLTQNDNVLTSTVTIDSDGTWSVDVTLIQGANTFTATATDQAGNISDVSNSVTVTLDNTAPIITLTGANPQTIESGADYTELGATTDDGSDVSVDSSEYRNVVGTYIITYTDVSNSVTVTLDNTAPIITLTGANPQTIELGADYTELGATTDDGSEVSIDSSAYRNVVGTYIITYTATDGTNQATATRTVNVVDTTAPVAPVITSPATLTNENTVTITGTTVEGSTVTLTQNDNVLTSTVTIDSDGTWSVDVTLIQGANTFTATATDQAGNISDVSNSVTVTLDNTAPIITLTGANPQTIESGADYTELGATTDDGSDVSVDSSEYRNVVGTYIITYTATDGTNQATATRTVNVVDTTAPVAPVITSPTTLTNENTVTITGTTVEGSTVTLTQNDNVLTSTVTIDSDGTWSVDVTLIQGVNTFTATATDQAGNISDVSNSVTVTLDNTAPIITLTGANPQTIESGADYTELGATTDDGSEVSVDLSEYRNVVGTYIITYTATDGTNQATATRTVNVVDTTAPIITLTGANPQTIESGADYTELGATTDDGSEVSVDSSAYRNVVGTYIITYTATDGTNQATATRTVNVVDTTAPIITLTGANPQTIESGADYTELGATTDDGSVVSVDSSAYRNVVGTYIITYTATDGTNQATTTRTVNVVDTTAPVAPVITSPTTLTNENTVTITGTTVEGSTVTLTQNDNVLTSTVTIDSDGTWSVDVTLIQGVNTFTATATDQAGNISDVSNSVTVTLDNTAPIITLTGANPQTIELGADYTELGATTDDGSDVSIDLSEYRNVVGTYIITYTATDGTNQATATRTVNVVDTTAPIITLTGANPQTIELGADYTELGATTDDGSDVSIDLSEYRNVVGTYIITYTATDGTNQATATRTVNVVDTTAPIITLNGANPQTIEQGAGYTELGATADDGSTVSIDSSAFTDAVGSYAITYTATDGTNQATPVTRTVNVVDTTAPIITLNGANPQTIEQGAGYTELGASADDGSTVSIDSSAFTDAVGSYAITYTAADGTNQVTATRTVNVVDTTPTVKATETVEVVEKTIMVGGSEVVVASRGIKVEVATAGDKKITRFHAREVPTAKLQTIANKAIATGGIDFTKAPPSIDSTITPTLVADTAVDISVDKNACPARGCEVTLSYEAGDVPAGKDPYVFHYDETKGKWEALPHVRRDTINRKVTALATSFSPFALFNASRADKLAKQLNEEILPRLIHTMLGSTVSAVNSRMDDTFSGTPQVASYQFDGQTVQLDSQTGLSANLHNTVEQKLPTYIKSLKDGTMDWKEMLSRSAFVMPLNAAGGAGSTAGATVWGGGDYNRMSGKFSDGDWKGDVLSAQLGIDQRLGKDMLAGGLVSWSKGDVDYNLTTQNGKETRGGYTHQITSVHPYFARSNDEVDLWGSVGYGQGKLAIKQQSPTEDSERSSDTRLLSLSAGGSGRLSQSGLKLKSDIILAQVDIAASADKKIPADKLSSQRLRLLLEMGKERPLSSGGHFKPLLEVGLRYDGGVGESSGIGAVLNLGGHYANTTGLTVEGKLHTLLGQDEYQEWGIQGTIRQQANANGQGLSFSLNPSYGTVGISTNQVWQQELADDNNGTSTNSASLDVNMGYGLSVAGGNGLLTPYSELRMSDSNHYRLGLRWKPSSPLSLHLYGERETSNNSDRILLEGRIRF